MKLIKLSAVSAAAIFAACTGSTVSNSYTLTTAVDAEQNGARAYIVNYDTGNPIDSVDVTDGTTVFTGTVDVPVMARLVIAGNRGPLFVLEPGDISIDSSGDATGTPLNERLNKMAADQKVLVDEFKSLADDSLGRIRGAEIEKRYTEYTDSVMNANLDNPVGYYLFIQKAYELDLPQLEEVINAHPELGKTQRISKLRESLVRKAETSEGSMFKDFEVTYDGNTSRLSDYVGKGRYTLVDFWASWCGPCIRETATIKDLYSRFNDKGLDVLGVAVWDEPANTLEAIERHKLPWNQIINGQNIPTDIYGISSIPTIILFDPEGRIVSRGKQGADLVEVVESSLEGFTPAQ